MVGTDIIEVSRIERLIKEKGSKFLNKIYTQNEIDYCESKGPNKYQHYAGRFAAKEAIIKAIGDKPPNLKNIQISNHSNGIPYVHIIPDPAFLSPSLHISISHVKKYAVAFATIWPLEHN
tara:strand:+ start:182 stop:541 length:360 start_codon:yes stop_codon:yes gene_type:complete